MADINERFRQNYQKKIRGGYRPGPPTFRLSKFPVYRRGRQQEEQYTQPKIDDLPNASRLTPMERWIYNRLPGFAESNVGKALARFGNSWAGKALGYLDVAAEGLERVTGFGWQALDAHKDPAKWKDFTENIGDAWYAGSLTADVANLPILKRDQSGKITGYQIPTDLPGVSGLAQARRDISDLVDGGVERGEALKQVRDKYYNDQGALALRSQLYDTYFHVVADPLNYIMPALKPMESAQAARKAILAMGYSDEFLDATKIALKTAEEAQNLEEVARLSGILAEAEKPIKVGGLLPKLFTRNQKFTLALTGGDPFKPGKLAKAWWNPFALTPAARAHEYMTMVTDNVGTYILSRFDDPAEIAGAISRAAKGALGDEFGHAFLTIEGRTAQAALGGFEAQSQDLLKTWNITANERNTLAVLSRNLGENPHEIMKVITEGGEDAIRALSKRAGVAPDVLKRLGETLKDVAYTPDVWKLELMNKLADHAAQQGVIQFGVKSRGLLEKMSNTMKSAETLAFLRLNPAYFVKNGINNEMTMIARGLIGRVGLDDIERVWEKVGFEPVRLAQGFGMQGLSLTGKVEPAGAPIVEALRGERGLLDNISEAISGIKLGKLDISTYAQKAERSASRRAMTIGYLQGWNRYFWKPGKGFDYLEDVVPPEIFRQMPNDVVRQMQNAVASAMSEKELDDLTRGAINLNMRSILDDASQKAGFDVGKSLQEEYIAKISDGLTEAVKNGTVREYFAGLRADLEAHLDELSKDAVELISENARLRIQAEGPQGFLHMWEDNADEFWGAHMYHATRMEAMGAEVRSIVDPKLRGQMWDKILAENEGYWKRAWGRYEGILRGMRKGAKDAGIDVPEDVETLFKGWKDGWRGFFSKRNSLYKTLKEGKGGRTYDDVAAEIDDLYRQMMNSEDDLTRKMDEAVASLLPDEQMKPGFLAWRDKARELRRLDRQAVIDFRQTLAGLTAEQRDAAFRQFWQQRMNTNWTQQWQNEKLGTQMLAGSPQAAEMFDTVSRQGPNALRRLASEYGISSVTEQGIPLDRRLLATVNKYLPEGTQPYERIEDIPYDIAQQAFETRKGVKAEELKAASAAVKKRAGESYADLAAKPRNQLDPGVSKALEEQADRMLTDLEVGEPGKRLFDEEGQFLKGKKSTYPEWYGEIVKQAGGKEAVMKALRKIIQDQGLDTGKTVERLKAVGLQSLMYGTDKDPRVLRFIGDELGAYRILEKEISEDVDLVAKYGYEDAVDMFKFVNEFDEEAAAAKSAEALAESERELRLVADQFTQVAPPQPKNFIPDLGKLAPQEPSPAVVEDQYWLTRGFQSLDALEAAALETATKKPLKWADLPADVQEWMGRYINKAKGQMADARYASLRFGEFRRDAALLNYNRRMNYNTWLGTLMPYEFWFTQSIGKWALHSIDRPAMLSTYLRLKKFLNTAGLPNQSLPTRLKGSIKIDLPFLPDWMGDSVFVDPMRMTLPFDSFAYPYEDEQRRQMSLQGRAERVIQDKIKSGQLTAEQGEQAMDMQVGPVWEQAMYEAQQNDDELKFDAFDFVSLMSSPHAPLVWAKEALEGTPEDIQPFTPMSRMAKGAAGLLGIDWNNSPYNIEAKMRKALGLPAFDKWDDYRVERMLANMAARNEFPPDEIRRAMIEHKGDAWDEATRKANIEFGVGALGSAIGLPTKAYPAGEQAQRELNVEFGRAYDAYNKGDVNALTGFFDKHPEFEARLALFKKPEERMQTFLVDEIWDKYNNMPDLHKRELREQLGTNFTTAFLDKATRSYESIPLETLQTWLRLMGGDPPGTLSADTALPLDFAPPEQAWRAQTFYDTRERLFADWYDLQSDYYKLAKGAARKQFLSEHPELSQYWDWRRDFFTRNPDTVPYLTDQPYEFNYKNEAALRAAQQGQPNYTWYEWQAILPAPLRRIVWDYAADGDELSPAARDMLETLADQQGVSYDDLLERIVGSMP